MPRNNFREFFRRATKNASRRIFRKYFWMISLMISRWNYWMIWWNYWVSGGYLEVTPGEFLELTSGALPELLKERSQKSWRNSKDDSRGSLARVFRGIQDRSSKKNFCRNTRKNSDWNTRKKVHIGISEELLENSRKNPRRISWAEKGPGGIVW